MKARIKGTTEWKDYKEAFGQYGEFIGLETKGYQLTDEEWCKENGIEYDPELPFNGGLHYVSAILPLEAFDLCNEPDWQSFRNQAAKDILCSVLPRIEIIDGDFQQSIKNAIINSINVANELIKELKEKEKEKLT